MFEYACEKCEKSFVSGSKLKQHNNQLHEEVKCDECGKMFKKGNFARHRKVHADSNSVLTCQICAKTFSRTLRTTSDQFVEAAHHKVQHFIESHPNYNHVDKSTEQYGQAILSCVTHFNSNNL